MFLDPFHWVGAYVVNKVWYYLSADRDPKLDMTRAVGADKCGHMYYIAPNFGINDWGCQGKWYSVCKVEPTDSA